MYYGYKISDYTADLARRAEADCQEVFKKIDENDEQITVKLNWRCLL